MRAGQFLVGQAVLVVGAVRLGVELGLRMAGAVWHVSGVLGGGLAMYLGAGLVWDALGRSRAGRGRKWLARKTGIGRVDQATAADVSSQPGRDDGGPSATVQAGLSGVGRGDRESSVEG